MLKSIVALVSLLPAAIDAQACVSGSAVHIVIARGTTEPQGPGLQGVIANAIVSRLPGSDIENVIYPASFTLPSSPNAGITNMTAQVTAYNARCPNSKMVFMGYSQGAQVVGDVVNGGGTTTPNGSKTNRTPPLPSSIMSSVVSLILFGDPNRDSPRSYNKGTCTVSAKNPRTSVGTTFDSYAPRVQDYCDKSDPVCCSTGNNIIAHLSYFNSANGREVANFVASQTTSSRLRRG